MRAAVLLLATSVVAVACSAVPSARPTSTPRTEPRGSIAWSRAGELWTLEVATKRLELRAAPVQGGAITGAAWAPDGRQIVFAEERIAEGARYAGADLKLADLGGGPPTLFAQRDTPMTLLESPTWARSNVVYYDSIGPRGTRVLRQPPGGQADVVVEGGRHPSLSADETTLIFVRNDGRGDALWRRSLADGSSCELIPPGAFAFLGPPRVSPDGTLIALGASGEPTTSPLACSVATRPEYVARALLDLLGLTPRVALAHGRPWAIWILNVSGGGLRRVGDLTGDDLTVAWAPDGARLAVLTSTTLQLLTVATGGAEKVVDVGGEGTLDWR